MCLFILITIPFFVIGMEHGTACLGHSWDHLWGCWGPCWGECVYLSVYLLLVTDSTGEPLMKSPPWRETRQPPLKTTFFTLYCSLAVEYCIGNLASVDLWPLLLECSQLGIISQYSKRQIAAAVTANDIGHDTAAKCGIHRPLTQSLWVNLFSSIWTTY